MALPAAIGVVALVPAAVYLQFVLGVRPPSWLGSLLSPVSSALRMAFQQGPIFGIILIWLAMFFVLAVHESGQALAAVLIGWPILVFRVAPFSFEKQGGNWKLHLNWKLTPPGLVVANPSAIRFHSKVQKYSLAGPVANLVSGTLGGALQLRLGESDFAAVLALFAGWSIVVAVLNLLPIRLAGAELDGYVAFVVRRKPRLLSARVAAVKMQQHVVRKHSLDLMNQRWVALAEGVARPSLQSKGNMWLAYCYWLERDKFEHSAIVLEKLLRISHTVDEKFRSVLLAESAVISALRGRKDAASVWHSRASGLSMPELIRHRLNSYVAWINKDIDKALLEAELTNDAASKLENAGARETFLRNWKRWITELENTRDEMAVKPAN